MLTLPRRRRRRAEARRTSAATRRLTHQDPDPPDSLQAGIPTAPQSENPPYAMPERTPRS